MVHDSDAQSSKLGCLENPEAHAGEFPRDQARFQNYVFKLFAKKMAAKTFRLPRPFLNLSRFFDFAETRSLTAESP